MSWGAVIGGVITAYGGYQANRAARRSNDLQEQALGQATTWIPGVVANGLAGSQVTWSPSNALSLTGGTELDAANRALSTYAQRGVPSFSNDLPANVRQALNAFQGVQGVPNLDLGGLDQIMGGTNQAFTQAQQGLASAGQLGGFDPSTLFSGANGLAQQIANGTPLSNQASGVAQTQLGSLGQTYDQAYGNTLNTLRAQAQPEEARAFANLNDNLFSTGRLGSSGGALQTEAFARGLGQADLSRQLAATTQAQQAQQNSLGLATGASNIGFNNMASLSNSMQGLFGAGAQGSSLQDQLLNSAYGRFGQTAQMAADLNQARFARSMYGNETAYNRGQNMLGTQMNLAGLPASLQAAQLGNVSAALQGQSGIQSQLLQLFGAGLSGEQAAANARIGAGSNMASIVGSPSFGAGGQANAAMWSQLGSSLMNQNGLGGVFGRIFGGGGTNIQSPDAWGALNDALARGEVGG